MVLLLLYVGACVLLLGCERCARSLARLLHCTARHAHRTHAPAFAPRRTLATRTRDLMQNDSTCTTRPQKMCSDTQWMLIYLTNCYLKKGMSITESSTYTEKALKNSRQAA